MQFGHLIRNFQLFSINHAHILLSSLQSNTDNWVTATLGDRIIRSSEVPNASTSTGVFSNIGVQPRIILSDLSNKSYIQSDSQELWYNNSDNYINIKPCQVRLSDIFQQDLLTSHCHISNVVIRNARHVMSYILVLLSLLLLQRNLIIPEVLMTSTVKHQM